MSASTGDLTGTFSRLTIRERVLDIESLRPVGFYQARLSWYRCDCACGAKDLLIMRQHLVSGNTRSCGCLRRENAKRVGQRRHVSV